MNFQIREATVADTDVIASFQLAMALETENKRLDEATVKAGVAGVFSHPGRGRYIVAERTGIPPGIIASLLITYEWSDWRNTNMWYIQSVYVSPPERRKGAFGQMYRWTVQAARENHVKCLRLYVETENQVAQSTYQRMGMSQLPYFMYQQELD